MVIEISVLYMLLSFMIIENKVFKFVLVNLGFGRIDIEDI